MLSARSRMWIAPGRQDSAFGGVFSLLSSSLFCCWALLPRPADKSIAFSASRHIMPFSVQQARFSGVRMDV
jgi:hypothetical protein